MSRTKEFNQIEYINKYVVEEMGCAEDITIRINLSNGESVEIWFDEYNDCYTWSNASYVRMAGR